MSDKAKAEPLDGAEPERETEVAEAAHDPVVAREAISPEVLALLRKVLPALWLLGVIAAGVVSGIELAFLVAAGGTLVLVITLVWSSVQSLTGSATLGFEEALGLGAPSKVEEQKRALLRALKDLDFERGVGKISAEDYAELSARYRAEAKLLMQSLDATQLPARQQVEALLEQRLQREGLEAGLAAKTEPEPEPAAESEPEPEPEPEPATKSEPKPESVRARKAGGEEAS